jgi:hypothetical protein
MPQLQGSKAPLRHNPGGVKTPKSAAAKSYSHYELLRWLRGNIALHYLIATHFEAVAIVFTTEELCFAGIINRNCGTRIQLLGNTARITRIKLPPRIFPTASSA